MINREDALDEAGDIADSNEAVGLEAIEITFDVVRAQLISYLRQKKTEYEAKNNLISAMTVDAMLKEVNNA